MLAAETGDTWSYHHTDGLGSVRMLTDASGAVTQTASYDPYGVPIQTTINGTSFGYAGGGRRHTAPQTDASDQRYLRGR